MSKSKRGFATMDPAKQREIASKGGIAAQAKGTAHRFTSEEARKAGRIGGQAMKMNKLKVKSIPHEFKEEESEAVTQ
jgi:general stress protein YciG